MEAVLDESGHGMRPGEVAAPGLDIPRRQGSRAMLQFWYCLRYLSPAQRRRAAELLRESLPVVEELDTAGGLSDLRSTWAEFVAHEGRDSASAYRQWHANHPDKAQIPSMKQLRRLVGGTQLRWDSVKRALGDEPAADIGSLALAAYGSPFNLQELVDVVRLYAADSDTRLLSGRGFLRWCDKQHQTGTCSVRVPLSMTPVRRCVGSFAELISEAGLVEAESEHRLANSTQRDSLRASQLSSGDLALLREAGGWADGRYLSEDRFRAFVHIRTGQLPMSERFAFRARANRLLRRAASWPAALFEAGLIDGVERSSRTHAFGKAPIDRVMQCLAFAIVAFGRRVSIDEYREVQARIVRAEGGVDGRWSAVPSYATISNRLGGGSWRQARKRGCQWIDADCPPVAQWVERQTGREGVLA